MMVFTRLIEAKGLRADMAALLMGAVAALALPPLHVLPALLVAFPVLLGQIGAAGRPRDALRRGWWFGFGYHLIGLYWITEAILIEAARFWWFVPIAVPSLAALLAVFIAIPVCAAWFAPRGPARIAALAGAWVLSDLARQFIATGFPWNPLGSVWAVPGYFGDVMLQPASLVSVHGLTLATIGLACAAAMTWRGRFFCLIVLQLWAGFGAQRLAEPKPPDQNLTVVLVQGNVPQGQKWDRAFLIGIFERYLRLSEAGLAAAGSGPRIVVWPETASPFQLEADAAARAAIAASGQGEPVLAGAVRFDSEYRPRNTLFALGRGGAIDGLYDKWHLVPFGEYQPDWIPIGIQVVPGGGFARGPGPRTLRVPGVPPVGPLICYEAIFPGQVVDAVDRPDWMVNVTNDAWFGTSTGPRQHLAAARLRAVEEGLPLLRAANTGISAAFDANGHEIARLEMEQTGFRAVILPGPRPPTLFARFGLWIPGLLSAGVLAAGSLTRKMSHKKDFRSRTVKRSPSN